MTYLFVLYLSKMKKSIFTILIGIAIVGCDNSLEISKENIIGNWYSCVKNSGYREHHFHEEYMDLFIESFDNTFTEFPLGYHLSNDTIYMFYSIDKNYINYFVIKSLSDNEMILTSRNGNSQIFTKITDKIEKKKTAKNIEEQIIIDDKFTKTVLNRKSKYNCQFNYVHQGEEGVLVLEEDSID